MLVFGFQECIGKPVKITIKQEKKGRRKEKGERRKEEGGRYER